MTWKTLTNEQRTHLIRSVWRGGITSAQIGMAVGATKNSIVGFYSRHRDMLEGYPLPLSVKEKSEKGILSEKTIKNDEYAENARLKRVNESSVTLSLPAQKPDWPSMGMEAIERFPKVHASLAKTEYDDTGLMVRLEDNNGCMWPLNDGGPYLFCGHAKLGKYAYCHHHHVRSLGVGTEGERRAHKIGERHVS